MKKTKYFVQNIEVTKLEFDTALNEEIADYVDSICDEDSNKDTMNDEFYHKAQESFSEGKSFKLNNVSFKVDKA